MSRTQFGVGCCIAFVTLEAFQAVYLGSVFQNMDAFLVGSWVFGISILGCATATAYFRPQELLASVREWRIVLILNVLAAATWITYFTAVQLIEPAVVFTIFSGMVPLGTLFGALIGLPEAAKPVHRLALIGNFIILISIVALGGVSWSGQSGFVRGGEWIALAGVILSAVSGGCTAFVVLYSARLNRRGVGPLAQFGLRFCFYTLLAIIAFRLGLDAKGNHVGAYDLAVVVFVGLFVIAFPLYLVQKAVPLITTTAIAAITSLGPIIVFLMQLIDGRTDHSKATLFGLIIYMMGALTAVFGGCIQKPSVQSG